MATTQINPTRMELTRLKKKLGTAVKGHRLLKDKRDELMREFLELVKVNMELREKVEKGIDAANKNFVLAKAGMSEQTLRTALMTPKQEVFKDMLKLAEVEKSCQLMAAEIEKTRRRVNALEHVIIPETKEGIRYITMKLDENERSTQVRLMKVKNMMLEQAHKYKEKEKEKEKQ